MQREHSSVPKKSRSGSLYGSGWLLSVEVRAHNGRWFRTSAVPTNYKIRPNAKHKQRVLRRVERRALRHLQRSYAQRSEKQQEE